jgi:hypothetical protein
MEENMDASESLRRLITESKDEHGWALVEKKLKEFEQKKASMDSDDFESECCDELADIMEMNELSTAPPVGILKRILVLIPDPDDLFSITVADICREMVHGHNSLGFSIDHIKAVCEAKPALALATHIYGEGERYQREESALIILFWSHGERVVERLECILYLATMFPQLLLVKASGDVHLTLPMEGLPELLICNPEATMRLVKAYLLPVHASFCAELGIGDRDHALVRLLSDLRGSYLLEWMIEDKTLLSEAYTHNVAGAWKLVIGSTTLGADLSVLEALLSIDRSNGACCLESFGLPAFCLACSKNRPVEAIYLLLRSSADFFA